MKILVILSLIILVSCSPTEVPVEKLVERGGITYLINSQTPFSGRSVSYHENGEVEFKRHYQGGQLVGIWERYYENGQVKGKTNYKNGKKDGLLEEYHENGQLKSKTNYKDGELDGLREYYDENGDLWHQSNFKNGKLL